MARPVPPKSFVDHLNSYLQQTDTWRNLFVATQAVIDDTVGAQLHALSRLREAHLYHRGDIINDDNHNRVRVERVREYVDTDGMLAAELFFKDGDTTLSVHRRALHDRQLLINTAKNQGFDYLSDYFSDEDYARLVEYIEAYWPQGGQPAFVRFLGFVRNLDLSLENLWTLDKGDNATSDDPEISKYDMLEPYDAGMTPVYAGGQWYQTSHVSLNYDATQALNFNSRELVHLFYFLAPIHLVLERMTGTFSAQFNYTTVAVGDLSVVEHATLRID